MHGTVYYMCFGYKQSFNQEVEELGELVIHLMNTRARNGHEQSVGLAHSTFLMADPLLTNFMWLLVKTVLAVECLVQNTS